MHFRLSVPRILSVAVLTSLVGAVRVPGADTPSFYFVSSSNNPSTNLLPLRIDGGTGNFASLTGSGAIGEFYFYQGRLVAADPAGTTSTYKPYINSVMSGSGCTDYGALGLAQGSTTNKCANFMGFQIQSDQENSQLGAHLVFNYVGGFYACGAGSDVWYKANPAEGPVDCTPINLWTVPV